MIDMQLVICLLQQKLMGHPSIGHNPTATVATAEGFSGAS